MYPNTAGAALLAAVLLAVPAVGDHVATEVETGPIYRLTEPMAWADAEQQAVAWGGHLVTLEGAEEEDALRERFGAFEYFWIGFNDLASEGDWVWSSGAAVTYTNWCSGEPNNANDEDGAVINWAPAPVNYGDCWNDLQTGGTLRGIAEIPRVVPAQAKVRVGLVHGGNFTDPPTDWTLGPGCAQDVAEGAPAPSLSCGLGFAGTGEVFCGDPADPSTCNSNFGGFSKQFAFRQVKLLPVYVGEAAPGYTVQRYELSADYRLQVAGEVLGDAADRTGGAWLKLAFGLREPGASTLLAAGHVGTGAGTECCPQTYTFGITGGWSPTGAIPVHEQVGGYAGQTLELVVQAECGGGAGQSGSANPVGMDVACQAWVDNVALDAVYATP